MTALGFVAFGVVGILSIGRPLLLIGLAMLVLGPVRNRAVVFWPLLTAVVAWNVAFILIAPFQCTTRATIGPGSTASAATTVCTNLLGTTFSGPGSFNPSREPATSAAFVAAALVAVLVLAAVLFVRSHRSVPLAVNPSAFAAAVIAIVVDGVYLATVTAQGTGIQGRVIFYAAFVAAMAGLCAVAAIDALAQSHRQAILSAAGVGLLAAGGLGLASIGAPWILAGLLALASIRPREVKAGLVVAAGASTLSVFVVGILVT